MARSTQRQRQQLTDALLDASRALVGIATRALRDADHDLSLPQYRTLVVLLTLGPRPVTVLTEHVGLHQTTVTRLVERLDAQGLVVRSKDARDRRLTVVALTETGRQAVESILARRRELIAEVVAQMELVDVSASVALLRAFTSLAGETVAPVLAD